MQFLWKLKPVDQYGKMRRALTSFQHKCYVNCHLPVTSSSNLCGKGENCYWFCFDSLWSLTQSNIKWKKIYSKYNECNKERRDKMQISYLPFCGKSHCWSIHQIKYRVVTLNTSSGDYPEQWWSSARVWALAVVVAMCSRPRRSTRAMARYI